MTPRQTIFQTLMAGVIAGLVAGCSETSGAKHTDAGTGPGADAGKVEAALEYET